jgi:predicted small secreted protein
MFTTRQGGDLRMEKSRTHLLVSLFVAAALTTAGCANSPNTVRTGNAGGQPVPIPPGQGGVAYCPDENNDAYCDDDGSEMDRNTYIHSGGYRSYQRKSGTIGKGPVYSGAVSSGQSTVTAPRTPSTSSSSTSSGISSSSTSKGGIGSSSTSGSSFGG